MTHLSSIETISGFDSRTLRDALGTYATGVAIVTTCTPEGEWVGMTINSFSSVSLNPPLILWSLALNSPSLSLFQSTTHYAINVLSAEQTALSQQFASRIPDKFTGVEVDTGIGGVPLLAGCCAWFECSAKSRYPGGDHLILLGHIDRFASNGNAPPLIFQGGSYRKLASAVTIP